MRLLLLVAALFLSLPAAAQIAPSPAEVAAYRGLHAAAAKGDAAEVARLVGSGANFNERDGNGRAPLHVAVHLHREAAAMMLLKGHADPNALDAQQYDI